MAALRIVLGVLALSGRALTASLPLRVDDEELTLEPQITGGFLMVLTKVNSARLLTNQFGVLIMSWRHGGLAAYILARSLAAIPPSFELMNKNLEWARNYDERNVYGHIGRTLYSTFTSEEVEGGVLIQMGNANLTVLTVSDDASNAKGIRVTWNTEDSLRFEDCFDFGSKHWYGGKMRIDQIYPLEAIQQNYSAYASEEQDNGAVVERYWLNSAGEYIYVHPQVPLFVDYQQFLPNHICFGAQIAAPYSTKRNHTELSYDIWFLPNVKQAHQHAVANYLGKPSSLPDLRMIEHPIWSTWAQFSQDVTEEKVLDFAEQILSHGFNNSQLEIDDLWETCYGSLEVDTEKFPNMSNLVEQLKASGFRVTIWVHPFINNNCEPWYSEALNNGYLVLDEAGTPKANWWNANGSEPGLVDFTNPAAAEWWYSRVRNLLDIYNIDSIKFDAGESSFAPQIPVQTGDIDLHPHNHVEAYVRTCARFGDMVEVRAAFRTQDLPIYLRMVDRDSIWGMNNGLPTIVTSTLQMNLNGYPFVLPDMIGGNGFNLNHEQADIPSKELFIRWVQANTFLPVMQYSYVPWNFDNETIEISKKYTELHAAHLPELIAALHAAVEDGTPVNAPLWWLDPENEETYTIRDEYVLGENIVVAPVLTEGTTFRDVYLPSGRWLEDGDPERIHQGPKWIKNYPAPINALPYFVREVNESDDANVSLISTFLVILMGVVHIINRF